MTESTVVKPFKEMTDAEFFVECSRHLAKMCDRIKTAHENMAEIFKDRPNDSSASAMLEFSMYSCLEGIGDILNGIDLVDEHAEECDSVFKELHRRFPKAKK
jgi:hypothetical protein